MHLHTVYMEYSECLPTLLNPLAERTCFSQVMTRLAEQLEPRAVPPGALIIAKGDRDAREMYFIREGRAEVLADLEAPTAVGAPPAAALVRPAPPVS